MIPRVFPEHKDCLLGKRSTVMGIRTFIPVRYPYLRCGPHSRGTGSPSRVLGGKRKPTWWPRCSGDTGHHNSMPPQRTLSLLASWSWSS